jgi:5'-phosphate synthase pdxT subunit
MILLSRDIVDGDDAVWPLLDVSVKRNAFGRQLDSFEADLQVPVLGDTAVHGVFIRAPVIERVGPDVDVLSTLEDGRVVAVRQRNVLATAFHPELAGETRFHSLLATMAGAFAEPEEGGGRRHHPTRRSQARVADGSGREAAS